jgi:hypothetical protein
MSKAKNEPEEQAIPQGGSPFSINEPAGSDVLTLRFTVDGIDPATADTSADVVVTVTGTGFDESAQVVVDGAPVATEFVSDTTLTATLTAAAAAGTASVSVAQTGMVFEPGQTFTWTDPVGGTRRKHKDDDDDDDHPHRRRR